MAPRALRALSHRNYQLFFGGQLISLTGTWMQSVAQSWLIYRMTGSAMLLGVTGFCSQIPVFALAPIGGVVADRGSRYRVIVAAQISAMILAFILAALTLAGRLQIWEILVLAALLGVVNAFDIPARQAFVVEMVGREDLISAIALNSSMFNGARIVGPAIAGLLVAAVGEGWCFFLNGASYIAVIAGLLLMRLPKREATRHETSPFEHMREGFRYVAHTAPIRVVLILLALVSLLGIPYAVLMPIFADRILGAGPSGLGILMGMSGLGALAGALTLAARRDIDGLGNWVVVSALGFGATLVAFAFSKSFLLSAALLIGVGFCLMTQMAASNTLIQMLVPDRLRGRVMAVYSMMIVGMAPFGSLLAGILAKPIGVSWTVAVGGAACGSAAFFFRSKLPLLREAMRPHSLRS